MPNDFPSLLEKQNNFILGGLFQVPKHTCRLPRSISKIRRAQKTVRRTLDLLGTLAVTHLSLHSSPLYPSKLTASRPGRTGRKDRRGLAVTARARSRGPVLRRRSELGAWQTEHTLNCIVPAATAISNGALCSGEGLSNWVETWYSIDVLIFFR
jgi:hypothetical protein